METGKQRPLIVFSNDDGIASPGLWAAVSAFNGLADLLVVAPQEQQSGMGRSMPSSSTGMLYPHTPPAHIENCVAYGVHASPAQAIQHAVLELAERPIDLVISGINYGENVGNGITISGTVGAALEAASLGVPALAISQQTPFDLHLTYDKTVDFSVSAQYGLKFGMYILEGRYFPADVDVLKIDVPADATPETGWRMTRVSRQRVYFPTRPDRDNPEKSGRPGYRYDADASQSPPDSDVYVTLHEGLVSVSPMSLDMSSRLDLAQFEAEMQGDNNPAAVASA
ncbi:MAG: 5'/3'-nucleotidase SurE [Aggregatilineales bacterium]